MNKTFRKAIMLRSKLNNRANRSKDTRDIRTYKQQSNLVVRLNKDSKISILGKNQNHFEMLANLILRTNIAEATKVLC